MDINTINRLGFLRDSPTKELVHDRLTKAGWTEVNRPGMNGFTVLHFAADDHGTGSVRILVEDYGADTNAVDEWGQTPLYIATRRGYQHSVKALLRYGSSVNTNEFMYDDDFESLIHLAVSIGKNRIDGMGVLIKAGADVNALNWKGETPLHLAYEIAHLGRDVYIKMLRDEGAELGRCMNRDCLICGEKK